MTFSAVIVAAGSGTRAGPGQAKQWRPLAGKAVLRWSVEAFLAAGAAELIIVASADGEAALTDVLAGLSGWRVARGGATRALSVSARERGSMSAPGEARPSLSHDARRRSTRGAPGPRRRPREARRARRRRPRTPSRAPRAWRGSRPRGGRAQERPRRVRRSRPFGPRRRRGAAQTARGTPPTSVFRGVRSGDAAGVAGQNRARRAVASRSPPSRRRERERRCSDS